MSIYATIGEFGILKSGPRDWQNPQFIRVWIQGVPPHIDYTGEAWDWLPPPIPHISEDQDGKDYADDAPMRAIVFVLDNTEKGTVRCGQEYVNPLLIVSGEEYSRMTFIDVMEKVYANYRQQTSSLPEEDPSGEQNVELRTERI